MSRFLLFLFLSALALVGVILLSLHKSIRGRLSVRIAVLLLLAGPIAVMLLVGFNALLYQPYHHRVVPWWAHLLQVFFVILGIPLIIGLLAARFIRRPLNDFNRAIASLKQNDYKVELQPTGISEIDKVFAEFNDLTKRLMHEEELRKNLISDTSHELNTPLAAMVSQLTAMQEGVLPITKARVQTLAQQTDRLHELVSQLNEYTRARSSAVVEEKTDIHLYTFCMNLREVFASQLQEQGMELEVKVAPSFIIAANQASFERIMTNLIQNALRYSGGKIIRITAAKKQLSVSDDGRGVPAESLPYLFERFYRVDQSRSRETGGLGLGLAIVRELVHRQGWNIHAEDNAPGLRVVINFTR